MLASARVNAYNRLDALFKFGVVGDLSDGRFVHRFMTAREGTDQAAFTALVERHGPMVLSVCRRVLGDAVSTEHRSGPPTAANS